MSTTSHARRLEGRDLERDRDVVLEVEVEQYDVDRELGVREAARARCGTAATMSMSLAALRIHSVSAPSSIRWSSTMASRMRSSGGSHESDLFVVHRQCGSHAYWSAGLSTRHSISTNRLEFCVESLYRPTRRRASHVAGSTRFRGTPVSDTTMGIRDLVWPDGSLGRRHDRPERELHRAAAALASTCRSRAATPPRAGRRAAR